ncbi:HNH endonuclease [Photobacterium minamisatsumaniensis]|uniref:HNH endonuclease n=1 Tax=Photobacterium minamisatsumaniensis TaxID=2910233 RepID=UPI003D14893C
MNNETRTGFVNRVMRLSFKSTQGKYSYCNDDRKQVLFSLDSSNGDVILSPDWSKNGYAHSMKHIAKVLSEGYELFVFRTKTKTNNKGEIIADGFEPILEKRKLLLDEGGMYRAVAMNHSCSEELHDSAGDFYEGAKKTITVNAYERNNEARQVCINELGCSCRICGFNFESVYGVRGEGFIHVHHIVPIKEINSEYKVNPIEDLIPVCPNCHAMLHRNGHTLLPEELSELLMSRKYFRGDL